MSRAHPAAARPSASQSRFDSVPRRPGHAYRGDFLRHQGKPEWGTGDLLSVDCDKIHMRQHVFWPYPENFGVSPARAAPDIANGATQT